MKQYSWYWVRMSGSDEWYPAMYDKRSQGGWTNTDTWEDFGHKVVEWQIITPPNKAYSRLKLLVGKIIRFCVTRFSG